MKERDKKEEREREREKEKAVSGRRHYNQMILPSNMLNYLKKKLKESSFVNKKHCRVVFVCNEKKKRNEILFIIYVYYIIVVFIVFCHCAI